MTYFFQDRSSPVSEEDCFAQPLPAPTFRQWGLPPGLPMPASASKADIEICEIHRDVEPLVQCRPIVLC